ncbi:MAG: DUF2141 domain-containing protein [Hyphococcus sp.]
MTNHKARRPGYSALRSGAVSLITLCFAGAALAEDAFEFDHVSCTGAENEIRIVITGVEESVGLITADLYPDNEETFLRGIGRVKKVKYAARAPVTRFCMTTPEAGDYALAVYHDRNANGSFDKTGLGLPNEPWGISNNPRVRFAPPPVSKALFGVTENGAEVEIKLN